MNSKKINKLKKKSKNTVKLAPCDRYNKFNLEYEEYKRRQPKILLTGEKGDRRKKNIFCRKKKTKYYIKRQTCPYKKLTKKKLLFMLNSNGIYYDGDRSDLCHLLTTFELNKNPYQINNICKNNINNINNINVFRYKDPIENRYYCITYDKMDYYINNNLNNPENNSAIPDIVKYYYKNYRNIRY